jgi:hypothetical protein
VTRGAVGVLLSTREAFVRGELDPMLALADAAAELGFDYAWAACGIFRAA